jgi:hypothetical protein
MRPWLLRVQPWIAALIGFVLILPSVELPWSLLDDWFVMERSEQFVHDVVRGDLSGTGDFFFEPGINRVRPAYWLVFGLKTAAFGSEAWLHHLFQAALFALILWLLVTLTQTLAPKDPVAFLPALLFGLYPIGWYNWFRQDHQEPWMLLWSLLACLFLLRGSWLAVVLAPLPIFTKEPGIVIAPLFALLAALLWRRQSRRLLAAFVTVSVLSALLVTLLVVLLPKTGGVASLYHLTIPDMLTNGPRYAMYLAVYVPVIVVALWAVLRRRPSPASLCWPGFWLVWTLLWFGIHIPLTHLEDDYTPRYALPMAAGAALTGGLLLGPLLRRDQTARILATLAVLPVVLLGVAAYQNFSAWYLPSERADAEVVRLLAREAPLGTEVYVVTPPVTQIPSAIPSQLRWLYGRRDIVVSRWDQGTELSVGDWVIHWSRPWSSPPPLSQHEQTMLRPPYRTIGVGSLSVWTIWRLDGAP